MDKLHLIMPMGGRGVRFFRDGFVTPKPLIELEGKPFFYWAAQSVLNFVDVADLRFVVLQEHVEQFGIDRKIYEYYPEAKLTVIPAVLPGAVLTCMEGVKDTAGGGPLLFNDCDHLFLSRDFYRFCETGDFSAPDGGLLTFASRDPRFSYAVLDETGRVTGTVEKQPVSDRAICGAYYFKDGQTCLSAAEAYLTQSRYEEFFVSGVYDCMAAKGQEIRCFDIDLHISFGTPEEYAAAVGDPRLHEVEQG